ncbi:Rha family transcriptional regulator [Liquorilactobacillus nagelii]|uniref:Rha family transcriptional regulator n=1 Tax=Liquorilactobacillus nagelii TaxID=82688 RepID=UPI0039EA939B
MQSLVKIKNDQPVTTSLNVAKTFEKEHKNVVKRIREISLEITKAQKIALVESTEKAMFLEGNYKVKNNFKSYPMFYMNKDGFTLLVMGFSGRKATQFKLQYIAQFNRMTEQIKQNKQTALPRNYPEALRQLAEKIEENERLKTSLENPKLDLKSQKQIIKQSEPINILYGIEEIAKECGYSSGRKLNNEMYRQKVIYPQKDKWYLYSKFKNHGFKDTSTQAKAQKWTEKGRKFIKIRFSKKR